MSRAAETRGLRRGWSPYRYIAIREGCLLMTRHGSSSSSSSGSTAHTISPSLRLSSEASRRGLKRETSRPASCVRACMRRESRPSSRRSGGVVSKREAKSTIHHHQARCRASINNMEMRRADGAGHFACPACATGHAKVMEQTPSFCCYFFPPSLPSARLVGWWSGTTRACARARHTLVGIASHREEQQQSGSRRVLCTGTLG
ncbi:hypothetical protein BC567DRAFT_94565 [Phyllosticta citribraziliensis]